jgi:hypothetical protein
LILFPPAVNRAELFTIHRRAFDLSNPGNDNLLAFFVFLNAESRHSKEGFDKSNALPVTFACYRQSTSNKILSAGKKKGQLERAALFFLVCV